MQDIFTTQSDYTKNNNAQKLIVALRNDGFSFLIYNLDSDSISAIQYKTLQAEHKYSIELELFLSQDILKQTFTTVQIIWVTSKITIIPSAMYKQEDLRQLFSFNTTLGLNEEVFSYKIKNAESYFIYAIPEAVIITCKTIFNDSIQFYPQAASFIESSILQNKLHQHKTIYISLESNFFDILLLNGSNILLYNTFEFTNINDFVYYVMNIVEQLQLNPTETKIILSGKISKASTYYESLQLFVKEVSIIEPFPSQKDLFSHPYNSISFPLFSNLCNVSLCE